MTINPLFIMSDISITFLLVLLQMYECCLNFYFSCVVNVLVALDDRNVNNNETTLNSKFHINRYRVLNDVKPERLVFVNVGEGQISLRVSIGKRR